MSAPETLPPPACPDSGPQEQARMLQTLCDHFPGGVTVMDHELRLRLWNRRFLEMMELPPELFAQSISLPQLWHFNIARGEFGPVQDPDALVAGFVERALRFEPHAFTRVRPNGRVIEIRGEPIAEGGFVTTWVDVTEHHRLETELHRHDALVTQIVNHLPQGISLFDEQLVLQLWNQAFIEVLEFPPEAVFRGARFEDLLGLMARRGDYGPGDPTEQVAQRLALARQFQAHRFERTRPNGRTHLVEGRPIQLDGRLAGFVTTYTDITTQKTTEQALRRANDQLAAGMAERSAALDTAQSHLSQAIDQLAQSEKLAALGQLVAGVAHELNTPIGNSVMAASTFLDRVAQFEAEARSGLRRSVLDEFLNFSREAARLVQDNLARAAELIDAFKQVAVDQTSMRRREFLLDETVRKVCATMAHTLRRGQHRFEIAIPQGITLNSHPGALEQILTNLISNSLVHGFEGRAQGCIRIEAHGEREEVGLSYQDDGVGLSPEAVRRIFEPFFTTKLGQGGTGLGLHISHTLATTVLGGQITAHSQPGQGARFELRLPRVAPLQGEGASPANE
ncbi:sensor histidine kinase [Inhella proteolytica]|uniref:histidine kinase n=1 Tax=Inhella proteolytica TaxID=2795029 RepID=A0A931IZ67_9BURK|nr:PAS-domain containing protein [Inhella proteolytica]MBH9575441.1 PAS-domain containing protein [Inhella proteolytica]